MTMCELIGGYTLPEGVTPVYTSLLGLLFRAEDTVTWGHYEHCMSLLSQFGVVDKEWFI